jgi:retron-type reverse transcriptase
MTQADLLELRIHLFEAYYDCRRNKRNTTNAIAFEIHFEDEVRRLYDEIVTMTYRPGKSIAFIIHQPVMREIFAADFRDRVVHHFVINRLNPVFEKLFIHDSYSCRQGKGTLFGIERMEHHLRSCSQNYTRDCYVLKLDIEGFFMHIKREILYAQVSSIVEKQYWKADKAILLYLFQQIIFQNPLQNCLIKGELSEWDKLPPSKSLFHMPPGYGLPIGNLTSQVFANVYLNDFDHYVKRVLKVRYYGRYVDDFVLMNPSKEVLLQQREQIRAYLKAQLNLDVHPNKEYLQHYSKGFSFLGAYIKPFRKYVSHRAMRNLNILLHSTDWIEHYDFLTGSGAEKRNAQLTSYLGLMQHFKAFKKKKQLLMFNNEL